MAGTISGGKLAAQKNMASDPDFYRKIGSIGGSKTGVKKGFAAMTPEQRSAAGKKGGRKSRKGSDGTENSKTKFSPTSAAHAAV